MQKRILFLFFCGALFLSGCLKRSAETPPSLDSYDPLLAVNFTLGRLYDLLPPEGAPVLLDSAWTVSCIVRADDETGNFYNQLILEDSTGGIMILMNESSLYTRYPIGRKLYLHLKGLYLGNDHGTPQLGLAPAPDNAGVLQVSDIPAQLFRQYITTANITMIVPPLIVNTADLKIPRTAWTNRLIEIRSAELVNPGSDLIYSDPAIATSIKVRSCEGTEIVLRTSNYARFQAAATPAGNGSITAIYSIYNSGGQLSIRDTTDMKLNHLRCDGTLPQPPVPLSIDSLRMMYKGKDTGIGNYLLRAVVTSDVVYKNFGSGNIIVQQGGKGIMIYFGSSVNGLPALGDSVEINISGATLTKYNDALEVKNIKISKVKVLAQEVKVTPVTLTILELNEHFDRYESVLVRIRNGKITSSGKFAGSKLINDGTGTITLYTSSSATFAGQSVPTITKTFQGIATPYGTTNEVKIRNPELDIY